MLVRGERLLGPWRVGSGLLHVIHLEFHLLSPGESGENIALVGGGYHAHEAHPDRSHRAAGRGGLRGIGGRPRLEPMPRRSAPLARRNRPATIAVRVGSRAVVKKKRLRIEITAQKKPDA